jgi:hypothetical protein
MAVYLQEIAPIAGGGKEAYLEIVRTKLAPALALSRGMRLLWLGSTVGSTGRWPETIAIWELRDWDHWATTRALQDAGAGDELPERWREATRLRPRPVSRTLVPVEFSPTRNQLLGEGVCGTAFAFATFRVDAGGMPAFLDVLRERAERDAGAGRALVGAWQVAFTNDEMYVVWAHRTLAALVAWERSRPPDDWGATVDSWSEHWGFAAAGSPLWPKDLRTDVRVW